MKSTTTSTFIFIWFGAAVSLAEILTGTFFAPLGFERGMLAVVIGHLIGCTLFWLAAYIGAKTGKSAMETVKLSFGKYGSFVFSFSNVAQLIGWTSIMIFSGAAAARYLVPELGQAAWCVIIGALIVIWIALSLKNMSRVQTGAALLLLGLTMVMSFVIFGGMQPVAAAPNEGIAFGAAVELAVAMPLSWLPVVSDYTRHAKKPKAATTAATLAYFVGSTWMFALGLGAALFAGSGDIAQIFSAAGLGVLGILIVVFSTVTTTFLDAASAGFSARSILSKINAKWAGIIAALIGTALAIFAPVARFEEFLYLIGSIFAPMIAVMIVDFYFRGNDSSQKGFDVTNIVIWLFGFVLYRVSMSWDIVVGNTLPVILIVGLTTLIVHKLKQGMSTRKQVSTKQIKE
ncbi:MAG: putative hydroxymethylpyrimidine transporter CytX [Raoultibacter sp.]|jgi:putative hydroxymethylpyrimidine transporter CytX